MSVCFIKDTLLIVIIHLLRYGFGSKELPKLVSILLFSMMLS